MLTDREARVLLAHAMAYDARIQPGDAIAAAWVEASRRARWTYDEALEAVLQHYAESADWLMPGVVTQRIRAARQDAAMRAPQEPAPNPIGQKRLAELTAGAFRAISADDPSGEEPRSAVLLRPCPFCQAKPGEHCTRRGLTGRVRLAKAHPSRLEAAS